ncbi:helix-turn-helix domain-containing protein [Cohnella sp.]|uniref:response regulator transcription factor n=1 Tax=Cohnella sp. TaxID=1883426 RepID=UPI003562B00F
MVNVLIVDDEIHAVRGLQAGVHWDRVNIDYVHTAHNLKQAQERFNSHPIDLMICDIEMPQGSGLELAAWVKEFSPRTETIFLTCHSDFSFAKQALQLNSFDYLLKPVDYTELEAVIGKALGKMKKERELRSFEETHHHYRQLWETHQPVVAERFWLDLIQLKIPAVPQMISESLKKANLSYPDSVSFLPIYIQVRRWHKELSERDQQIMGYALRNVLEEAITEHKTGAAVIPVEGDSFLTVIPVEGSIVESELRAGCDEFIHNANRYFYCDISCYIGKPVALHEMVPMLRSLQRLDKDNITEINRTLVLGNVQKCEGKMRQAPLNEWAEWMKQGARDKLAGQVTHYLECWTSDGRSVDAQMVHSFYQEFLQMVFFVLQSKGLQAKHVFAQNLLTDRPASVLRSLSSLQEWVRYVLEVAMNHIHATEENMSVVEKAKRYITDRIGEPDLSREDIASYVFLNPDYLTRVFKKETGISLSDFLQQRRIEYAKELLINTDQSVSDIALASGYSNLSYFSTIFKKATSYNPVDFRKRARVT